MGTNDVASKDSNRPRSPAKMIRVSGWSEVLAATFKPSFPSPNYNITTSIWSVNLRPRENILSGSRRSISSARARRPESAQVRAHPDFESERCLWQLDEGLMVWRGERRDNNGGNDMSVLRQDGSASSALQRAHRSLSGDRLNYRSPEVVRSGAGFSAQSRPLSREDSQSWLEATYL